MVQVSNGSTQRNAKPPAPSTVGKPSGPSGAATGRCPAAGRPDRPGSATLIWMSWCPSSRATASIPMRGSADLAAVVDDPEAHRVPHLGVLGPLGEDVLARRVDTAGQVKGHRVAPRHGPSSGARVDVVARIAAARRRSRCRTRRVGVQARLAFGGGLRPPTLHRASNSAPDRCPQPGVQAGDLTDRIGLHGRKSMS